MKKEGMGKRGEETKMDLTQCRRIGIGILYIKEKGGNEEHIDLSAENVIDTKKPVILK